MEEKGNGQINGNANANANGTTFRNDSKIKHSSDDDPEPQIPQTEKDSEELKLDSNGLPLVPQPSRFKDDPLVSENLTSVGARTVD